MSLMYHVTLGEDDKLRIRPVDVIASLHDACCEIQDMHLDSQVRQTLDIRGSALDLQMRFKRGSAHAIRISVLESADRREHTDIVLHMPTNHRPHIGYLTVDAASSSLSEDIQSRIPENTKFDLAEDELLNVRILVDKCMVEVFVNDRVVLMQMMYLDDLKRSGFFDKCDGYCAKAGITWQDVIPPPTIKPLAPMERLPFCAGISRRMALSSSTRPVRQKCSKRRSTRARLTAKRRPLPLCSAIGFIPATRC